MSKKKSQNNDIVVNRKASHDYFIEETFALIEIVRMIREDGARPALVIGMPVGFVSAAESKDLLAQVSETPWIIIRGRKGGSSLVVGAIHALLALAEARQKAAA